MYLDLALGCVVASSLGTVTLGLWQLRLSTRSERNRKELRRSLLPGYGACGALLLAAVVFVALHLAGR